MSEVRRVPANRGTTIDLVRLIQFILKRIWLPILCAAIGFGGMYYYAKSNERDTYSCYSTLYVYNANPNLINYNYTNTSDLMSANKLLDTYMVVIKSNKVMDAVVEQLHTKYPGITAQYVMGTISMGSVGETGVLKVVCTTSDPQMCVDICNAVVDYAPPEIIRVVSAGSIEVIDYAELPKAPNAKGTMKKALLGGMAGAVLACGLLVLVFLMDSKVADSKDLTNRYTLPVLSEIPRTKSIDNTPGGTLLNIKSSPGEYEAYNKLRMNLGFAMVGKRHVILITSAVPGEGKSTIGANLAITMARSGKRVLLVDGDMRCGSQGTVFSIAPQRQQPGLSNLIIGECGVDEAIILNVRPNLDLMPTGSIPPNPTELLASDAMSKLLERLETSCGYDMIIMDMPPINAVSDPLILAKENVGLVYVTRQNYSDHKEIQRALRAAEFSGIDVLGMILYGEKVNDSGTYRSHKYTRYYNNYQGHNTGDAVNKRWALTTEPEPDYEEYDARHQKGKGPEA